MASSHWIGSLRFELRSSDERALEPVRRLIRERYADIVQDPLADALDRVDRPGRMSRFGRIECDLGVIPQDGIGEALGQQIADKLFARLRLEGGAANDASSMRAATDVLLMLLETGRLPWGSPGKAIETVSRILVEADDRELEKLVAELRRLFAQSPATPLRFACQCPLFLVLEVVGAMAWPQFARLAQRRQRLVHADDQQAVRLAAMISDLSTGKAVKESERSWLENLMGGVPIDRGRGVVERTPTSSRQTDRSFAQSDVERGDRQDKASAMETGDAGPDFACTMEAAGTVILYPFVADFAAACGLLAEDRTFKSDASRARAVLLLHLAATGNVEAAEPELLLAKLLLGHEPQAPVPRAIKPSAAELSEIAGMLAAAVSHWQALGDTSGEALREAFLNRPGRLSRTGEDWRLTIEPRGVDVLLDRLPWSISIVMTFFMTRPLRVEWR